MDNEKVLDAMTSALTVVLNQALPRYITAQGLDPWKDVASGSETLGKINLGICKAKVKASYTLKDMTGLSSMVITQMKVVTRDTSQSPTITGVIDMSAMLNANLTAKLKGKLTAECAGIKESVSISGKATAKGVIGKSQINYVAYLTSPQSCFTEMTLNGLTLMYDSIKVDVKGLGVFNSVLDPLVDAISGLFGDAIKSELASVLQPLLNDLIKSELPFCIVT